MVSTIMKKSHLLLAILVTLVWGMNFPITKLGLAGIDPLMLTAIRFTLAALPWVFFIPRPQVAFGWIAAYGAIFGVAMWALINQGIAMGVPPGSASLLIQCSAFFTLGLGVLLFRDSLTLPQCIGIALAATGLAGILLVSPDKGTLPGFVLILISAMAWSIGNIIIKLCKVREIFAFVVWASLIPPIPLFALTFFLHGAAPFTSLPAHIHGMTVFSVMFQVYGATHFCYWGWNMLLRENPVSRVAPLSLLIPVSGIASSAIILGQYPGICESIPVLLILAALIVGLQKGRIVLGNARIVNAADKFLK